MELVMNTFKIEKSLHNELMSYTKQHHISKSDFIRQALIRYLEEIHDLTSFNRTKNDKIYTLEEVENALDLED